MPPPFTWIGPLFWIAFAWAVAGELPFMRRDGLTTTAVTDRGSKNLLLITTAASVVVAFVIAVTLPHFAVRSLRFAVYLAGVFCIVAGGWLRRHCFRMLGESFSYDVSVASGQRVVDRGAYKYVRHPSYTAGLLIYAGIGLSLCNRLSIAVTIVPALAAYGYRITVEERALVSTLGPAYADYSRRTKRLIPFLI